MELGTASIVIQLVLIFLLVAVFTGRRHLRARRERRDQHPGAANPPASTLHPRHLPVPATPELVELPPTVRRAVPASNAVRLVAEELLPPCFADTCADWAQVEPVPGKPPVTPSVSSAPSAPNTRFSLADWSAPTDRVALDHAPDTASLDWALDARVETPRRVRPAPARSGDAPMSCTIAQPARHCA